MNAYLFEYTIDTKAKLRFFKELLDIQRENKDKVFIFDVTMPSEDLVPKFEYYVYFDEVWYLRTTKSENFIRHMSSNCQKIQSVRLNPNDTRRIYDFKPFVIK